MIATNWQSYTQVNTGLATCLACRQTVAPVEGVSDKGKRSWTFLEPYRPSLRFPWTIVGRNVFDHAARTRTWSPRTDGPHACPGFPPTDYCRVCEAPEFLKPGGTSMLSDGFCPRCEARRWD